MKVKSESEVAQSCPTFRDPMDCSPPGSSTHGIFQARVLEWGAIPFSGLFGSPMQIMGWRPIWQDFDNPDQIIQASSVQFSSVAQSCLTLCNPMNCSMPGLLVHRQRPGFTQTHVHRVSDAIQPSHPLSSPSPPAPNPSQHQSLFQ